MSMVGVRRTQSKILGETNNALVPEIKFAHLVDFSRFFHRSATSLTPGFPYSLADKDIHSHILRSTHLPPNYYG